MSLTKPKVTVNGWVDVHAHFSPPLSDDERQQKWKALREGHFLAPTPPQWTVESTLTYMDSAGISMQLLSNIPKALPALRASNDYGASVVSAHPTRFGLLAALPTDNCDAALAEIKRAYDDLNTDGFAVTCHYNGVYLSDTSLEPMWAELNRRHATVFAHPDAYAGPTMGRPAPVVEVAFETARTIVDMFYSGLFRRYPNFHFVAAHCGGALSALVGRLSILGTEEWISNPNHITRDEMEKFVRSLYYDTAAVSPAPIAAILTATSPDHIVYGSDCGVPCTTEHTMNHNLHNLINFKGMTTEEIEAVGHNIVRIIPSLQKRLKILN